MENAAEEDFRLDGCGGPSKTRARRLCSAEGCTKQARSGASVCVKHGAKVKRCSVEGCNNQAQRGGVCIRHGAKAKRCRVEGCDKQARVAGFCIRHGAKVKRCSVEGCNNHVQRGGLCKRHGAKVEAKRCSVEGCNKREKEASAAVIAQKQNLAASRDAQATPRKMRNTVPTSSERQLA